MTTPGGPAGPTPRLYAATPTEDDGVPFVEGWPERLLGVTSVELRDGEAVAEVETGPWLSWDGRSGAAGALGVLLDDVLGYAIILERPPGRWSVSTEISIDLLAPVPLDGRALVATARVVQHDERGGFATGEVRTAAGDLVAVARQRGRFVEGERRTPPSHARPGDIDRSGDLSSLLFPAATRPWPDSDGRGTVVAGPRFANPLGNLHGGISLLLADRFALDALGDNDSGLTTASIHVDYVRPLPEGSIVTLASTVLHRGRTTGVVQVVGRAATGKPGTLATVTLH